MSTCACQKCEQHCHAHVDTVVYLLQNHSLVILSHRVIDLHATEHIDLSLFRRIGIKPIVGQAAFSLDLGAGRLTYQHDGGPGPDPGGGPQFGAISVEE